MPTDPAEIIRTLAAGHVPGQVHMAWNDTAWTIPTSADINGSPLLLVRNRGELARALDGAPDGSATVAVRYDDKPPLSNAPLLGTAWLGGWATRVDDSERAAAVTFAENNPIVELLDIGAEFSLWRVEVVQACLESDTCSADVGCEEYALAQPDPFYAIEQDLLADLYDHHPEVLEALTHRLRHAVPDTREVLPLRMNRHGVTVEVYCGDDSLPQRYFIKHRHDSTKLSALLRELTGCGCHCAQSDLFATAGVAAKSDFVGRDAYAALLRLRLLKHRLDV